MCMDREQENFAAETEEKPTEQDTTWDMFEDAYGGWLEARGRIHAGNKHLSDEEMDALGNKEAECARALWSLPAEKGYQVFMKMDLLEHYFDKSDWADQRDLRLLASIKADLRELLT